ncbi:MAG: helix-turn-helix domain-containing GNAT family N-acetyltransferase [Bacteroidota bacterium]
MPTPSLDTIEAVRRFNRFYTRQIGVVNDRLLESPYSLTEARVLYELAQRGEAAAQEIGVALRLDAGYLSRIVQRFEDGGLLVRRRSTTDGRQRLLSLTPAGRDQVDTLHHRARMSVGEWLAPLTEAAQTRLLGAMETIERAVAPGPLPNAPRYRLRTHRAGDLAWMVERHLAYYDAAYGWGLPFERLVLDIAHRFLKQYDPRWERCWIAELTTAQHGEARIGSVFAARESASVARLRMLLVEPEARGWGLGQHLVDTCVAFAREAGYKRMVLSTVSLLRPARRLYTRAGFKIVETEPEQAFGEGLTEETWAVTFR